MLLLFGGEDDVQAHLARYRLDRLRGVEIDELPGIGHHFDDPEDVERVAEVMQAWLHRQELGTEAAVASHE